MTFPVPSWPRTKPGKRDVAAGERQVQWQTPLAWISTTTSCGPGSRRGDVLDRQLLASYEDCCTHALTSRMILLIHRLGPAVPRGGRNRPHVQVVRPVA